MPSTFEMQNQNLFLPHVCIVQSIPYIPHLSTTATSSHFLSALYNRLESKHNPLHNPLQSQRLLRLRRKRQADRLVKCQRS